MLRLPHVAHGESAILLLLGSSGTAHGWLRIRSQQALASYLEATNTLRATLGRHPLLGSTLLGYATALYAEDALVEAEAACAEAGEVLLTSLGEANEEYSIAVELRGLLCTDLGRHGDAQGYYRTSAELLRKHHGDGDRALIDEAWAAEAGVMAGDGEAGLQALEELWNAALLGHTPGDPVPQAVERTGLRASIHAQDGQREALWRSRLAP